MELFVGGLLVGAMLASLVFIISEINKMQLALDGLKQNLGTLAVYLAKIDKTTMATMVASETFVDSLRMSAEMGGMGRKISPQDMSEHFRDLTDKFNEGIDGLKDEEGDDDDDIGFDDNEPPKEPWKK